MRRGWGVREVEECLECLECGVVVCGRGRAVYSSV